VHAVGGLLLVDSTFAPPPLQYPFRWGADCVLHSGVSLFRVKQRLIQSETESSIGSKYFGGHSDLLSGVLVLKTLDEWKKVNWLD
jgi:cystathionine gamma-synthase